MRLPWVIDMSGPSPDQLTIGIAMCRLRLTALTVVNGATLIAASQALG